VKLALLLNRRHARLRVTAKRVLNRAYGLATNRDFRSFVAPEYDSFGWLTDEPPVVVGTGDPIPWDRLTSCDALLWEWGWTVSAPRAVLEIHARQPLPTLVFPGPIDKFWNELDASVLPSHLEAARLTSAVGVMLRDTIGFYDALMPWAHVFHMPVPLDLPFFDRFAVEGHEQEPNLILLTAPTRFTGKSSELPIASFAAFQALRRLRPDSHGLCFAYSDEESQVAGRIVAALGLEQVITIRRFQRPLHRYLALIRKCAAGLFLPRAAIQGRTAMIAAAIGLPMVVSDEIETHRYLFGSTSVRWTDATAASNLCARLLEDRAFRSDVVAHARQKADYYSIANCRNRLANALAYLPVGPAVASSC